MVLIPKKQDDHKEGTSYHLQKEMLCRDKRAYELKVILKPQKQLVYL